MSWNGFGRRGLGSHWLGKGLVKAPRRRELKKRLFGRCEALEPRQMLSADGFVFGVDPIVAHPDGTLAEPIVPLESTFTLHSNPDADHTIYLDFDGHITDDAAWYAALWEFDDEGVLTDPGRYNIDILIDEEPVFVPGIPFSTEPYDLDGSPFDFNDQELMRIQEAFLRVSEDFAPFNVNVTTEEPPLADLENAGEGDTRWGVRTVVGGSTFDWLTRSGESPEAGAGGVALLGSFAFPTDTPAYAFEEGYSANAKNLAEVISHEVGHTLGLLHDGQFVNPVIVDPPSDPTMIDLPDTIEYYPGHDNGLWGPIMGAGYNPTITQWSRGEYDLANNTQDDLATITAFDEESGAFINGFGYRDDDHDDEFGAATNLPADFELGSYSTTGLIETTTDIDWFTFDAKQGEISIAALPLAVGANLDIKIELIDQSGAVVATAAPDFDQTASLLYNNDLPQRFYVSVTGDGFKADAQPVDQAINGYSDYGSLGVYSLDIAAPLGNEPDRFEDNNSESEVTILPPGDYFFSDLSIHENGDEDWFLWESSATGQLTVETLFSHSTGDIDFRIFTEAGVQLALAGSSNDNESATVNVVAGEKYFIRVYGFGGSIQESYGLRIDGNGLVADALEFNNTAEAATNLGSVDQVIPLSLHFDGDKDWFEWLAPADGTLSIETLYDTDDLTLTIEVYDANDSLVSTSQGTPTGAIANTQITLDEVDETSGLFRVKVFSQANDPAKRVGDYTLRLNGTDVFPDGNEPNNSPPTAVEIQRDQNRFFRQSINTPTDRDFYSFTPSETGTLRINLFHLHDFGDLDVRLTDSSGQLIGLATSRDDNEALVQRVLGGEQYFIEVFGFEGQINAAYSLETFFSPTIEVPGDFTGDALVTLGDRLTWVRQYGMTGTDLEADANDDGIVNAADFTIWRDNLGNGFQVDSVRDHDHDHDHAALPDVTPNAEPSVADPTPSLARVPYSAPQRVDSWIASEAGSVDTKPLEAAGIASPLASASTTVDASASNESPSDTSSLVDDNDVRSRALLLALTRFEAAGDDESVETSRSGEEDHNDSLAELDAAFGLSI